MENGGNPRLDRIEKLIERSERANKEAHARHERAHARHEREMRELKDHLRRWTILGVKEARNERKKFQSLAAAQERPCRPGPREKAAPRPISGSLGDFRRPQSRLPVDIVDALNYHTPERSTQSFLAIAGVLIVQLPADGVVFRFLRSGLTVGDSESGAGTAIYAPAIGRGRRR